MSAKRSPEIPLRATLRLHHAKIVDGRRALGLNQSDFADACGVSLRSLVRLEHLDFSIDQNDIERIAGFLMLDPEAIVPEEARGRKFPNLFTRTRNVSLDSLAIGQNQLRSIEAPNHDTLSGLRDVIGKAMEKLTYREREILKLRFGLEGGYMYTLEECGKIFRITRERVRMIAEKAIRKLQHPGITKLFEQAEVAEESNAS